MYTKKTQALKLSDLREGDIVWSNHFKRYVIFQEFIEDEGYMFRNVGRQGLVLLLTDDIEPASDLIKELL